MATRLQDVSQVVGLKEILSERMTNLNKKQNIDF